MQEWKDVIMPYDNKPQAKSPDTTAMDIARADSQDCKYCQGSGLVTVYAPNYDGSPFAITASGIKYASRVVAHCFCPLGRFIRAATKEDVRRRIPEVSNVLDGRSRWLLVDPTGDNPISTSSRRER